MSDGKNENLSYEKPDGYNLFREDELRFYYRRRIRFPTAKILGTLTLEQKVSDDVSLYRNRRNDPVLEIYVSIPTFDSGDREWDSYRKVYLFRRMGRRCALVIAGGYSIANIYFYLDFICADSRTKELLESSGFPWDA